MAYMEELTKMCLKCGKIAKVKLFNRYNSPMGEFCRSCGRIELKRLNEAEKEYATHYQKRLDIKG